MTTGIVKSGGRSLEVMEFFADCREASVMEVARALDYPQSSTSELLRTMTALGYLRYCHRRRVFSAGARAGLLGAALSARVFGVQNVTSLVDDVSAATDREAHVCDVIGGRVHYLIGPTRSSRAPAPAPMLNSAAGHLYLATMSDDEAASFVARHGQVEVAASALANLLTRVRRAGHALVLNQSHAELAVPLNRQSGPALSLSGAGFGDDEQAASLARRAREVVRRWRDAVMEDRTSTCTA